MAQISEFLSDGREDVSGKTLRFAGQRGLNQLSGPCLFTADDAATFRAELNH